MNTQTQTKDGKWIEAIPLAYHCFIGYRCSCGKWFLTRQRYEEHYLYHHIINY